MYNNVVNKMDYSGFHKASYLDPQTRTFANNTWGMNNTLTTNLIMEGKTKQADQILMKCMRDLPLRNYSISDTISRISTIQNLYALHHLNEATKLTKETSDYLNQEFTYISSLDPEFQQAYLQDIRIGLYVLNGLDHITADYQQKELNQSIRKNFKNLADHFGIKV